VILHYVTLVGVRGRHMGFWMGNLTEWEGSLNDLGIDDDDLKGMGLLSTGFLCFRIEICGGNLCEG